MMSGGDQRRRSCKKLCFFPCCLGSTVVRLILRGMDKAVIDLETKYMDARQYSI